MAKRTVTTEYVRMDPNDLIPYEDNPRDNDSAVPAVANSIEDFDFITPIEVNTEMVILSGHTRRKAALQLGLKEVPVIIVGGLTKDEEDAYRIAANETAGIAGWLFEKKDIQVKRLQAKRIDMSRYGVNLSYMDDAPVEVDMKGSIGEKADVGGSWFPEIGDTVRIGTESLSCIPDETADAEAIAHALLNIGLPRSMMIDLMKLARKQLGRSEVEVL